MGTKLGTMDKKQFLEIICEDMLTIQHTLDMQMNQIWMAARNETMRKLGHPKLLKRMELLRKKVVEIQDEIHNIQTKLDGRDLTPEELREFEAKQDGYGRYSQASFHGIPICNRLDYETAKYLKSKVDFRSPLKFLHDLGRSAVREITMSGTFEDAQAVYQRFYAMDFRKYGVDIPPRLIEIKATSPLLNPPKEVARLIHKEVSDDSKGECEVEVGGGGLREE